MERTGSRRRAVATPRTQAQACSSSTALSSLRSAARRSRGCLSGAAAAGGRRVCNGARHHGCRLASVSPLMLLTQGAVSLGRHTRQARRPRAQFGCGLPAAAVASVIARRRGAEKP